MEKAKLYGRAILGVIVAILIWNVLAATNIVGFAAEKFVDDGKLGNVPAVQAIPWLEIASSIFGWALFVFTRLGDGAIAGIRAVLGLDATPNMSKSNAEATAEVTEAFRRFYEAYQAKRQNAIESAGMDLDASMQSILSEVTQRVEQ